MGHFHGSHSPHLTFKPSRGCLFPLNFWGGLEAVGTGWSKGLPLGISRKLFGEQRTVKKALQYAGFLSKFITSATWFSYTESRETYRNAFG